MIIIKKKSLIFLGVADVEEEAKGKKNSIQVKNPPGGKSSGPFWWTRTPTKHYFSAIK